MNGLGRKIYIFIYIYTFQQSLQWSILQRYLTIQHLPNKIALSSNQYSLLTFSWSLWKIKPSLGPWCATDLPLGFSRKNRNDFCTKNTKYEHASKWGDLPLVYCKMTWYQTLPFMTSSSPAPKWQKKKNNRKNGSEGFGWVLERVLWSDMVLMVVVMMVEGGGNGPGQKTQ